MIMEYSQILKPPRSKVLKSGRVCLSAGEDVGEHITEKKEELIIILEGTATIVIDGKVKTMSKGECYFIPENTKHNVINRSKNKLEYVYTVALL